MARRQNIKRFYGEKGSPLHYIQWSLPAGVCLSSEYLAQGGGGLSLSLTIGYYSGCIPSASGKAGCASLLCSTALKQHIPICGTCHSL